MFPLSNVPDALGKRISDRPLTRVVLKDRVSEVIKEAILSGRLEPGERIVEMKVAKDMGVATTAVREALFELEAQGFVSRSTNRGTFVTKLASEDVDQILRIRRELEGLAAELVQERATEEDLALLDQSIEQMRAAAAAGDLQTFYRCDLDFHRMLWRLSGNRFLAKVLDNTVVPLFAFFIMKNPRDSVSDLVASAERHREIVTAIRNRENARGCMQDALRFFAEQEQRLLFQSKQG